NQSFQLGQYKTFEALHATILARFNILVNKGNISPMISQSTQADEYVGNVTLYQNRRKVQLLEEITDGPVSVLIGDRRIRDPQGPRSVPFFQNYFDIYPDYIGNYRRLFDTYGGVIKVHNIRRTYYLTNNPEVAKLAFRASEYFTNAPTSPSHPLDRIQDPTALFLCDTESPAWKEAHKFLPPSMSPKAMKHHLPNIIDAGSSSFKVLDQTENLGHAFNVFKYTSRLAAQVSAKLVLGVDLNHFESLDTPVHRMMELVERAVKLNTRLQVRGKLRVFRHAGTDPALLRQSLKEAYGSRSQNDNFWERLPYTYIDQSILEWTRKEATRLPFQAAATSSNCLVDYLLRATDGSGKTITSRYIRGNILVPMGQCDGLSKGQRDGLSKGQRDGLSKGQTIAWLLEFGM
ncbi:cytochrome P450, partial [Bipolaris maydis]